MRNGLNATEGQELMFYRIRQMAIGVAKASFNELKRSIEQHKEQEIKRKLEEQCKKALRELNAEPVAHIDRRNELSAAYQALVFAYHRIFSSEKKKAVAQQEGAVRTK